MEIVIKIIGVLFILMAILYLAKPDVMKRLFEFFKKGKRIYLIALIRFILAAIFLLAARECDITWLIFAFGILFFISGLLIIILGLEKVKSILAWYEKQPPLMFRLLALIALAIGVLIIYAA